MSDPNGPSAPRGLRKTFLFIAWLLCLCGASIVAQKSPQTIPPKYDLHTETKVKVTVEEVKLPTKGAAKEVAHLQVKDGTDSIDVYLCPMSFFNDMGMNFTKGDAITLTGSRVTQGATNLILAREVSKGDDTFVLRDEKGNPIWDWHR